MRQNKGMRSTSNTNIPTLYIIAKTNDLLQSISVNQKFILWLPNGWGSYIMYETHTKNLKYDLLFQSSQ